LEPSRGAPKSLPDAPDESTSPEELAYCRSAARKIVKSMQASIIEAIQARDRLKEGLISREDLSQVIQGQKIHDLELIELSLLLKRADRGNKGYIAVDRFIEMLQELVSETKGDVYLRQFAQNCKRQQISLKTELHRYDTGRTGRLDKKTFTKAMNQLPVNVPEDAVDQLLQAGESPDFRGQLDIKLFLDKVNSAARYNPAAPQLSTLLDTKKGNAKSGTAAKQGAAASALTSAGGQFETWEIEKKYKTKLSALQ
jgi:Ca2+-binding EF-hand superfamily protein